MGDILRTMGMPFWGGSLLICVLAFVCSPWAAHWFG